MNTFAQFNLEAVKLSTFSRATRIVLGATLLALPMSYHGVLGALAWLPLLAVYPILTGILGYGFVELLVLNRYSMTRSSRLGVMARTGLVAVGAGLIGTVMLEAAVPVWLALLGIFPVLMGLLGSSLVGESMVVRRTLQAMAEAKGQPARVHAFGQRPRVAVTAAFDEPKAA